MLVKQRKHPIKSLNLPPQNTEDLIAVGMSGPINRRQETAHFPFLIQPPTGTKCHHSCCMQHKQVQTAQQGHEGNIRVGRV